jgi:hypothetical protein
MNLILAYDMVADMAMEEDEWRESNVLVY